MFVRWAVIKEGAGWDFVPLTEAGIVGGFRAAKTPSPSDAPGDGTVVVRGQLVISPTLLQEDKP